MVSDKGRYIIFQQTLSILRLDNNYIETHGQVVNKYNIQIRIPKQIQHFVLGFVLFQSYILYNLLFF